jgi:hypothetical protein
MNLLIRQFLLLVCKIHNFINNSEWEEARQPKSVIADEDSTRVRVILTYEIYKMKAEYETQLHISSPKNT